MATSIRSSSRVLCSLFFTVLKGTQICTFHQYRRNPVPAVISALLPSSFFSLLVRALPRRSVVAKVFPNIKNHRTSQQVLLIVANRVLFAAVEALSEHTSPIILLQADVQQPLGGHRENVVFQGNGSLYAGRSKRFIQEDGEVKTHNF